MNTLKKVKHHSDNYRRNAPPSKKPRRAAKQISKPARRRVGNRPSKNDHGDTLRAFCDTSPLQTKCDASPAELLAPVAHHLRLILIQPQSKTEGTRVALEALGISFYKRNRISTNHTRSIRAPNLEPSEVARHAKGLLRQAPRLVVQASVANASKESMCA
jgi:hypothetical protein